MRFLVYDPEAELQAEWRQKRIPQDWDYQVVMSLRELYQGLAEEAWDCVLSPFQYMSQEIMGDFGPTPCVLLAPLGLEDQLLGLMRPGLDNYFIYDPEKPYLKLLGWRLQQTVDYRLIIEGMAQAKQEEREQRLRAEMLVYLTVALTSQLSLDKLMQEILYQAAQIVPYQAAQVAIWEGEDFQVTSWHYDKQAQKIRQCLVKLDDFFLGPRLMRQKQSILVQDTRQGNHPPPSEDEAYIRSALALPLIVHDVLIGILRLDSDMPGAFSEVDAQNLLALANSAAIALHNVQLYDLLQSELERHRQTHQLLQQMNRQLEDRVAARTSELEAAKNRVETILDSSSDVFILAYSDQGIQQTNTAFDLLFQTESDRYYGQPLSDIVVEGDRRRLQKAIYQVITTQQVQGLQVRALRVDGTRFEAQLVLSPVLEAESRRGLVCTLHDISAMKAAEADLKRALEKEQELNRLKNDFISMVSHEFRTPLANIQASSDSLRHYMERMSPEQVQQKFEKINKQVRRITFLIEDVLFLSKAQAGRLEFRPDWVQLSKLCHEVIEDLSHNDGGRHPMSLECPAQAPDFYGDRELLQQILNNLLSNALKYSPPDKPVTLKLSFDEQAYTLEIQDEGMGIPADDQTHLFESFRRGQNVGNIPGTGLGLAITKQAVDLHQGQITLSSQLGQGSRFEVRLPRLGL
jgi:PAS domain S-box-containing protein